MSVGMSRFDSHLKFKESSNMFSSKTKVLMSKKNLYFYARNHAIKLSNVAATAPITKSKHQEQVRSLPHLPVPKLSHTLEKYLKSVQPFLNDHESKTTHNLLTEFQSEGGLGTKLQKLLEERAQNTDNWLSDWWLSVAYLEYRDPVVVYSSPGLFLPCQDFEDEDDRLNYTTKLILAAMDYKLLIDSGNLPLDMMGKDPLDMNQYNKIFGTCRIPGIKRDHLEFNPHTRHIIVVKNNNYFKLNILNPEGALPSLPELVDSLKSILEESESQGAPIGVLTSDNRDNWGQAYQDLIIDPVNLKSTREIQTSQFLVCLDNPMPKYDEHIRSIGSKQLIHGGGSNGNSANRWFDKTVQFIVGEDGTVGLTYEHSPSEGQPIAVMTDYIVDYIKNEKFNKLPDVRFNQDPAKLTFNVDEKIYRAINVANDNIDKLAGNLDMNSFQFEQYGKEFIKSQKLSPDSFIQMAMQYAFYRIHKVPGAHYESAATRKYIHGRTETIRSCSIESINFAKTMLDDSCPDQEKLKSLKEAINAHKKYSVEAVNGFGVDRHMLGLKLTALENNLPVPDLYKDPAYTRSTHMRISTSQVATKCDGFMCYAPLTPDGYGCCYNPRPNDINFAVSAFVEHPETTALQFRQALEASLNDMHDLLAKSQKSKL